MMLEQQLERVTLEMASVQNVVTEMTQSFKNQIVIKDQEVKKCQETNASLKSFNAELDKKCRDLEELDRVNRDKISQLEKRIEGGLKDMKVESDYENLEHGSLDDLSNLVQAELDRSSELDNTLLSQVVTGLGLELDTTALSNNNTWVTEIQRLIRKIQSDGIKVKTSSIKIKFSQKQIKCIYLLYEHQLLLNELLLD